MDIPLLVCSIPLHFHLINTKRQQGNTNLRHVHSIGVTMNMTVTSNGVQFDRLGIMYLGDVEVFRTSTAEPGGHEIRWTYVKEMDPYHSLWSQPQKLIFDLGNLIDEKYTGAFNITLTATYFSEPGAGPYANLILPISKRLSDDNKGSAFSVPGEDAIVSQTLPRNVRRAVVSL